MLRAILALALAGCYSPHHWQDCGPGQMCVGDGPGSGDAAARRDALADVPADADPCPAACATGTCDHGTCVIDCSAYLACNFDVVCPAGVACKVVCGDKACPHHITCPQGQACDVECSGAYACGDQINCGAADCSVHCTGFASCHHRSNCGSACACDVTCTGSMSCPETSVCPMGCTDGRGCTSAPAGCDTCAS